MPGAMKRLIALLAVVAAAAVLAGLYVPSDAAMVGRLAVSRHSLDADLAAIASSPEYACFLSEERGLVGGGRAPLGGAGGTAGGGVTGVYGTRFVDDWLASMVTDRARADLVVRHGLTVSPADLALARRVLARRITSVLRQYASGAGSPQPGCGGSGPAVLSSLPGWFVAEQSRAEADQAVLDARAAGSGLSPRAVAAWFSAHRASFDRSCLAIIVLKTQAAADQVAGAIAGGASFAHEASIASITTGTGAQGGSAGCGSVAGTFLAPEVTHLARGTVSPPFQAEGVWWLVTVTDRSTVPFSSVQPSVVTAMLQAGQRHEGEEVDAMLKHSTVTVDARYGTSAHHRVTLITPPALPPPTSLVSNAADGPSG